MRKQELKEKVDGENELFKKLETSDKNLRKDKMSGNEISNGCLGCTQLGLSNSYIS